MTLFKGEEEGVIFVALSSEEKGRSIKSFTILIIQE